MARQLTILHISDLHARSTEGVNDQRKRQVRLEKAGRTRVLGAAFVTDLKELFVDKKPDIICFTGDIADWGLPGDYKEASKDLDRLLSELGVAKSRFFLVPGNHDVQRTVEEETWKDVRAGASVQAAVVSKWMAGVGTPHDLTDEHRTAVMSRTGAFWAWVEEDLERPDLLPKNSPHEQLGYRHTVRLPDWPFDIHVVGLDSAWLAGDDHDAGKLRLTPAQVDLLTTEKDGHALSGFRIGLVHHPLSDLADGEDAGRRLADTLDLLLHGHQHDPVLKTLVDPDRSLRVLAAGCLFEGQERDDYKNSYQRIDIWLDDEGRPQHGGVQFRGWSPRGHWYADASLYKNAPGGRLAWNPWSSDKPALARPKPAAPPTGVPRSCTPRRSVTTEDTGRTPCLGV